MPLRTVTVTCTDGLHARPAALFVQAATRAAAAVTVAKNGGAPVSARSILAVLGLDVQRGDTVVLDAEGDVAEPALDELESLLTSVEP